MTMAWIVGGIYSLDVEQDGERTVAYPGSLRFTGDREEAGMRREWEIAECTDMVLIEWVAPHRWQPLCQLGGRQRRESSGGFLP